MTSAPPGVPHALRAPRSQPPRSARNGRRAARTVRAHHVPHAGPGGCLERAWGCARVVRHSYPSRPPARMAEAAVEPNAYEQQRLKRIAANKQQLAALGLAKAASQLGAPVSGPVAGARPSGRGRARTRPQRAPEAPVCAVCRVARHCGCTRAHPRPRAERRLRFPPRLGRARGRRPGAAPAAQQPPTAACGAWQARAARAAAHAGTAAAQGGEADALPIQAAEEPTRISKRKRGEAAAPADGEAGEGPAPVAKAAKAEGDDDAAPPGPRARIPFPEPRADLTVVAPFTLRSIGCVAPPCAACPLCADPPVAASPCGSWARCSATALRRASGPPRAACSTTHTPWATAPPRRASPKAACLLLQETLTHRFLHLFLLRRRTSGAATRCASWPGRWARASA